MKDKKLVEIYSSEEDSFALGYLIYEDKKNLLINTIDDQGRKDGYLLFDQKSIYDIVYDSDFIKKIKKYESFWGNNSSLGKSDNPIFEKKPNLNDLIKYAHKYNKIVTIAISFDSFDFTSGYIKYFDDEIVKIDSIDTNSGKTYEDFEIDLKDIILFEVDSIDNILLDYIQKN